MKKRVTIACVVCVVFASPLVAAPPQVRMYYTDLTGQYREDYGGGEFLAHIDNPTVWSTELGFDVLSLYADATKNQGDNYDPSFMTFCLETDEYITHGSLHDVTFEPYAEAGGSGGPSPDPLSKGSAYLYEQFAKGLLDFYEYVPGAQRAADARELQAAFWALEQEEYWGIDDISSDIAALLAAEFETDLTDIGEWQKDNNGLYGVAVMNLHSTSAQSQMVLVPIPGAVLLGFLGLGYAGMKLRKMA